MAGWKFLAGPYYSQRAVLASPLSAFFLLVWWSHDLTAAGTEDGLHMFHCSTCHHCRIRHLMLPLKQELFDILVPA